MPVYELKNSLLSASVNSFGAELCSVKSIEYDIEYIWQADETVWARHAPILFPIVGKLKNETYSYQSKSYQLSQHGFARDNEFVCIEQSSTKLVFEFNSTKETLLNYPFMFRLQVTYTLTGNKIEVAYFVFNPAGSDLFFSIGAHPGFNCPLQKSESFDDYEMVFPNRSSLTVNELNYGLRTSRNRNVNLQEGKLAVSKSLFDNDAIVCMNTQIEEVQLISKKTKHGVGMKCMNWPFFGIWTKKNTEKFICLEPWYGITDAEILNGDFTEKTGVIKLASKSSFNSSFEMSFF